jgi:hypothetical protein
MTGSNFKKKGKGDTLIGSLIRFFTRKRNSTSLKVVAGIPDKSIIQPEKKKEGICQVEMGYFHIEDTVIPSDQIVSIYAMHVLLNRDLLDQFPEKVYYDRYKKLLTNIPDISATDIGEQLNNSTLEFYCRCGCHSFFVFTDPSREFNKLQKVSGLLAEVAFETNYEEELNVCLFTDINGLLKQVTVYFGQNNLKPIPEDIRIGKIIGSWGNISNKI